MLPMAELYLDLVEKALTGMLTEDPPIVTEGHRDIMNFLVRSMGAASDLDEAGLGEYRRPVREQGLDWPTHAFTMVGMKRLRNFRSLICRAIEEDVPGDILEAGVWRGGASILARAVLRASGDKTRRVIVADSFEGLPPPNPAFAHDAGSTLHEQTALAVSLEQVQGNFEKFGLLDERVVFLKGWFCDTLPTAQVSRLAVLRLDGDMYESTIEPLTHLYDKISVGGWVIIDDYFLAPCRAAVSDFLEARGLAPEIEPIDSMGVCFRKTS